LIKIEVKHANPEKLPNSIIGRGPAISATLGARIAKNRATRLHTPNAVLHMTVGNSHGVEMMHPQRAKLMPNLAISTTTGVITSLGSINASKKPPTAASENPITNTGLGPIFENATAQIA